MQLSSLAVVALSIYSVKALQNDPKGSTPVICPQGFQRHTENGRFDLPCLAVVTSADSLSGAMSSCTAANANAQVFYPRDSTDNALAYTLGRSAGYDVIWLNAQYDGTTLRWGNARSPMAYVNWDSTTSQPTGLAANPCVTLEVTQGGGNGKWDDKACDLTSALRPLAIGAICMVESSYKMAELGICVTDWCKKQEAERKLLDAQRAQAEKEEAARIALLEKELGLRNQALELKQLGVKQDSTKTKARQSKATISLADRNSRMQEARDALAKRNLLGTQIDQERAKLQAVLDFKGDAVL